MGCLYRGSVRHAWWWLILAYDDECIACSNSLISNVSCNKPWARARLKLYIAQWSSSSVFEAYTAWSLEQNNHRLHTIVYTCRHELNRGMTKLSHWTHSPLLTPNVCTIYTSLSYYFLVDSSWYFILVILVILCLSLKKTIVLASQLGHLVIFPSIAYRQII
jgi:hypothetical protein